MAGMQGNDSTYLKVASTLKHFAAYSQETGRINDPVVVTSQDMEDTYLPAFEAGIKKGKASGIMCSVYECAPRSCPALYAVAHCVGYSSSLLAAVQRRDLWLRHLRQWFEHPWPVQRRAVLCKQGTADRPSARRGEPPALRSRCSLSFYDYVLVPTAATEN